MNKLIFLFILHTVFSTISVAQEESTNKKTIIYLQAGGPSVVASINYERILLEKKIFQVNARFGIGTNRFKDFTNSINPDLTFPLGFAVNFKIKQMQKSQFNTKIGLGNTFTSIVMTGSDFSPTRQNSQNGYASVDAVWKNDKGIYLGLGYSPIFVRYKSLYHWGQLSIGYLF
tara:strand:- start:8431 stop:8949 length:519 start_codon:yes stop_codon:yes gene_type:complete